MTFLNLIANKLTSRAIPCILLLVFISHHISTTQAFSIIEDDNIFLEYSPDVLFFLPDSIDPGFNLTLDRKGPLNWPTTSSQFTDIVLLFQDGKLISTVTHLSEEVMWDFYTPGTAISVGKNYPLYPDLCCSNDQLFSFGGGNTDQSDLNYNTNINDIYIGFATGFSVTADPIQDWNVFGWARLEMIPFYPEPDFEELYDIYTQEVIDIAYANLPIDGFYNALSLEPVPGLKIIESAIAYGSRGITVGTSDAIPTPEPSAMFAMLAALTIGLSSKPRSHAN